MTENQQNVLAAEAATELLTPGQQSRKLTVPTATLAFWRTTNQGPKFLKIGRHVRYNIQDVNDWLYRCKGEANA